jgi:2-methylcitrate dehydratase PrpD
VLDEGAGFYSSFYRGIPYASWQVTEGIGQEPFYLTSPGVGVKLYPAGYLMHQAFEAALELMQTNQIDVADISEIEIGFRPASRFDRPLVRSGLDGKFSIQYVVAMAVLEQDLTIEMFSDAKVASSPVQDLLSKMRSRIDADLPNNHDIWTTPITITTTDGRTFSGEQDNPGSRWRYPLAREQWVGKFERNAAYVFQPDQTTAVIDAIDRLEEWGDVRELGALLAPEAPSPSSNDEGAPQ